MWCAVLKLSPCSITKSGQNPNLNIGQWFNPDPKPTKKSRRKNILITSLIVCPLLLIVIGVVSYVLATRNTDELTTISTLMATTTNVSMTVYDMTSTKNPEVCEKKWIGDGICDDVVNTLKCTYDGGDCCLTEIGQVSHHYLIIKTLPLGGVLKMY